MHRIAICAPSTPVTREDANRVLAIAGEEFAHLKLEFHPQCFQSEGHFAGSDAVRLAALIECANDPDVDAVWFARGGYGACRIAGDAIARLNNAACEKSYLGYSDAGYLLAALYKEGIGRPVHAPMPVDIRRQGGDEAICRVLGFLSGDQTGLAKRTGNHPVVAFNLMTLAMVCGTSLMPDLAGHEVIVEEVSEHLYAIDRLFFHVMAHLRGIAGIRLGRMSDIPENDRPFGASVEEIAQYWCSRYAVPFLGTADIGHDANNRIVPFGLAY